MGFTIDIDTGGTFTDGFFVQDQQIKTVKVPTTPHDLTLCFLNCLGAGAERFGVAVEDLLYQTDIIRFSNTIGTNTIIQRDGSKVGLLVTSGKEALAPTAPEMGRKPLVEPDMVLGVEEGISPAGTVLQSPDEKKVMAAAQTLIDRGARCLVVALANAEINPLNEQAVRQTIKKEYSSDYLGAVPVFLSADITGRSGLGERINTAVLNAYIHAKLVRLLYKANEELRQRLYHRNLFIVHNNGTVARVAKTRAINTYNSGPVAGLLGARLVGQRYGARDLISIDMGGTSFDLGYVRRDQPSYTLRAEIEGFPVNLPMLAIRAIGAGGGSIASVQGDRLQVGPQSAGALPGPVCFDLGGGEPTVTDADLVLGILDPQYFLGGTFPLQLEKARKALQEKVADPLGLTPEKAAWAIKDQIDRAMGLEVRRLREEVWPSGAEAPLLVVYGGAGPAHCVSVARIAGMKKIIITPFSAVFSAFSSSGMDVGHLYSRRLDQPLDSRTDWARLTELVASLKKEAQRDMRGEGFPWDRVQVRLELFLREETTGREIKLEAEENFYQDQSQTARLMQQAAQAFGLSGNGGQGLSLATVALVAQAAVEHPELAPEAPAAAPVEQARKGSRVVILDESGAGREIPVYDRALLGSGQGFAGPAVIESEQTTLLVPGGWKISFDQYNNALLEEVS
ncbi:MAG: hydantoinase/oxoprolinase family protein [Deltaproteobacteria bacterium]|nr:hydantoinase/oxoprolinase family protein [Deltaproteobacteria bacterium]